MKLVPVLMHSDGTELYTTKTFDRVCQNCNPLSCAAGSINSVDSVLRMSPLTLTMFFSQFREVVAWPIFFWIIVKQRIERCEEKTVCLPSLLVLSAATSPDLRICSTIERTFFVKYEFLPIVWNSDVTQQFRRYQFPTCVSLHGTSIQRGIFIFGTHATLESGLAVSSKRCT